jgi:hypothetical protein
MLRRLRNLASRQSRDPSLALVQEILKECSRHDLAPSLFLPELKALEHECRMKRIFKEARKLSWWIRHTASVAELADSGGYLMPAQAARFMALALPTREPAEVILAGLPTSIRPGDRVTDADGRVYVIQSVGYSTPGGPVTARAREEMLTFARADHVHGSPPYMVSDQVFQDWRAMVTGQVVHSPAPEEEADDEQA